MIVVRKASLEDYPAIHTLAIETWYPTYVPILSHEQVDYMLEMMYSEKAIEEQMLIKGHHFLLAYEEDKPVGFASYELNYKTETAKLHKLYVLPAVQGSGTGARLLSLIENNALKHHNNKITLNVNRYNKAVNFYLKHGFHKIGSEDIDIGSGYLMEDYIMLKDLS